ncbi:abortive infection family protein [Burkholderia gladioli]|uniref:abortive infection family protein n=1 Tax=Burkholderia gladioli TaxID=28095 RepID=UPI0016404A83|nr:abortive infection family protein [Burkholderia gladioli]
MAIDIKTLGARSKQLESKEAAQLAYAEKLQDELNAAFGGRDIYGVSQQVDIEPFEDDFVYGKLRYSGTDKRLDVLYRTPLDDEEDRLRGDSPYNGSWHITELKDCTPRWRSTMLSDGMVASLLTDVDERLRHQEDRVDRSLVSLQKAIAAESAAIDTEMVESLVVSGDQNLTRLWQFAVDATHTDSADALTRCSRFLEAVCAKILRERGVRLPKDKSMSPLVKACLDTLTWPAEREAEGDVRQLLGGIQSITNGIGALRTHFGTAHGATSHLPPLDQGYAVFVKQATVAAATFLLDRHQAAPLAAGDPSTAPAA